MAAGEVAVVVTEEVTVMVTREVDFTGMEEPVIILVIATPGVEYLVVVLLEPVIVTLLELVIVMLLELVIVPPGAAGLGTWSAGMEEIVIKPGTEEDDLVLDRSLCGGTCLCGSTSDIAIKVGGRLVIARIVMFAILVTTGIDGVESIDNPVGVVGGECSEEDGVVFGHPVHRDGEASHHTAGGGGARHLAAVGGGAGHLAHGDGGVHHHPAQGGVVGVEGAADKNGLCSHRWL